MTASTVARIGRPDGEPAADRAPEWVASGTPEPLRSLLVRRLGAERVLTRALDLVRYASDASPYRYLPQAVVLARDSADVATVLALGREVGAPVVLRSGGTSLNGQSQTDGILVDVRRHWAGVDVLDGGARCRVRPGTVLGHANRVLAPFGRKLGPDPASTDAATVGGVVANNSGGMRCGVTRDSYSTVRELKLVLASGTAIDTGDDSAAEELARREPELAAGLGAIRDEIRADADLAERIRRKFAIKNTMGYRLCAFLDADEPLEIFRRLVVGSEGTLAFVAEATFETVPLPRHTTVSWLHFRSIDEAVAPVRSLVEAGASAVELMVAPALIVASHNIPGTPEHWRELPGTSAALLVEFGGEAPAALDAAEARAHEALAGLKMLRPAEFAREPEAVELAWRVREGLFGLLGKLRPPGTALITEDVCVDPERIAEAAADVQALLGEHGFLTGVAGHASAGNLHFTLTPDLAVEADRERYEAFMEALVELIVSKYDGSLKAEHGTGLNMAPYLEREWGPKATEMMWRIKALADPDGVLGPGVILSRDPGIHLRNMQSTPPIEEEATTCVECGMCEPACPSRNTTTTPRQRILVRREMARQPEGSAVLEALLNEFEHDGIQTCAADGSCAPACPLAIDTGKLIKGFREVQAGERDERIGEWAAREWAGVERAARAGLAAGATIAGLAGDGAVDATARALRRVAGAELLPRWPPAMPAPASPMLPRTTRESAAAVYMPACINRIFGQPRGADGLSLPQALVEVSSRAGLPLWIPDDVAGNCCATPWSSKGYARGRRAMSQRVAESLSRWTDGGALPVVVDASSCAHGLVREVGLDLDAALAERYADVEVLDSIEWVHDRLLPDLDVASKVSCVAVHPTCSVAQMGLGGKLGAIAGELAEEVVVPAAAGCCGMAGDRGLLHPELPASALRDEAAELAGRDLDACLCSNRTCEIGLHQETGHRFESFVFLLERLTR
ncbi:MAG: FAD-binding and (Fe-S)-binding domain-containing protein [Solirubrobacterales bacterium]